MTTRIHSKTELENSIKASNILFGKSTRDELISLSTKQLEEIFSDVPQFDLNKKELENPIGIIDLLSEKTAVLPSKGEARRMLQANGISLNKEKVNGEKMVDKSDLIKDRFLIVQKGKKNYFLINAVE